MFPKFSIQLCPVGCTEMHVANGKKSDWLERGFIIVAQMAGALVTKTAHLVGV